MAKAKKKVEPLGSASDRREPVKINVSLGGKVFPLEIENESCAKLGDLVLMRRNYVWEIAGADVGGPSDPLARLMGEFNAWAKTHPNIFRYAALG